MHLTRPSPGDVVAGLSVALVVIPQSLAYAELAGLPAQVGLYAAALPSLLAAALVSSRFLQTGPGALSSLLTFGAVSGLAATGSTDYVKLAALLALMVGGFRLLMGIARLGGVAFLLSEPVVMGFTTGAAVLIVTSQLPKVFDVDPQHTNVLLNAAEAVTNPGDWSLPAMAFAAATAAIMVGGRRIHALFPGVLVAVILGVVASSALGYSGSTVGSLDGGFVSLSLDLPWSSAGELLAPALAIALVGFAEPAAIARTFASEARQPWNANRELLGQGVANLASGLSGAYPIGGSFSRSSLNRMAGATSPWAGAITGAAVLLALPLTPRLAALPRAILGAIVIVAALKLFKPAAFRELLNHARPQALVGIGTLVATVAFAPRVERGVLVGVALSLVVHLHGQLTVEARGRRRGDTVTVTLHGVLWFLTVPRIESAIRAEVASHSDVTRFEIDLSRVTRTDYPSERAIRRLADELEADGLSVTIGPATTAEPPAEPPILRESAPLRGGSAQDWPSRPTDSAQSDSAQSDGVSLVTESAR